MYQGSIYKMLLPLFVIVVVIAVVLMPRIERQKQTAELKLIGYNQHTLEGAAQAHVQPK